MKVRNRQYVYVVCGAAIYIDSVNLSLEFLKAYTRYDICIITDTSRNEKELFHDNILDVRVPEYYSNLEASRYLKTGLYKWLEFGTNQEYCYLDSDTICISNELDNIFDRYIDPIQFVYDGNSTIASFSSYAVHINEDPIVHFKENEFRRKHEAGNLLMKLKSSVQSSANTKDAKGIIRRSLDAGSFLRYIKRSFLRYDLIIQGYRYDSDIDGWLDKDNQLLYEYKGLSFAKRAKHDFGVIVDEDSYRIYNGGLFVFNSKAISFLSLWHKFTIDVFALNTWHKRDQGSLILALCEAGYIKTFKSLPVNYNFLLKREMLNSYLGDFVFSYAKHNVRPYLLHFNDGFENYEYSSLWSDVRHLGRKLGIDV